MNIDKIVEVNIQISEAMSIDGGYDTILIMGPLPKAPGGRTTPDVAGYANLQDLKSAGFASDDPVYIAASKVFGQSPKPTAVMIAVQKLSSGSTGRWTLPLTVPLGCRDGTAFAQRASRKISTSPLPTGLKQTKSCASAKRPASRHRPFLMQCFALRSFMQRQRMTA